MSKKKLRYTILFIFLLAISAGSLVYPAYYNKGADYINSKLPATFTDDVGHGFKIPTINSGFILGLDLQGGIHLVYEADLSSIDEGERNNAMQGLRDVIERRVNYFGVSEPVVQVQNSGNVHRLIVELAGEVDPDEAIAKIGQTPYLEFKQQKSEEELQRMQDKKNELAELQEQKGENLTFEEIQKVEDWYLAFDDPFVATELTGKYLTSAELGFDQTTYRPMVLLQFNDEGAKLFEQLTESNIGKPLAIYIDNEVLSAPTVQGKISGGKAQITGNFTIEEAKYIARNLNAGALPVPITLISQQSVGPTLGSVSLNQSFKAGIIGLLAIVIFMIVFYRIPGILASISLGVYVLIVLASIKVFSITLTLAGIGGFILSIGMAVDANILIFSRMKEELKSGKSFSQSIEEGFKRAWSSIREGNLTTLIVALVLFLFGTSFIKGFALTLSLGILLSMFSAIFITKNFLRVFSGNKLEKAKWLWR